MIQEKEFGKPQFSARIILAYIFNQLVESEYSIRKNEILYPS